MTDPFRDPHAALRSQLDALERVLAEERIATDAELDREQRAHAATRQELAELKASGTVGPVRVPYTRVWVALSTGRGSVVLCFAAVGVALGVIVGALGAGWLR